MFSIAFIIVCVFALYIATSAAGEGNSRVWLLLLSAYAVRILFQYFARNVAFFAHALGGDAWGYEAVAELIEQRWQLSGVHFVTSDEINGVGQAALPINIFAFIMYLAGGPAREACAALCAAAACITGLNLYKLAEELGVSRAVAYRITAAFLFLPGVILYTSDMYKDGLVMMFAIGALSSAIRLARKFSLLHTCLGLVNLWALWYVRKYLVFATLAPFVMGVTGLNSKSLARPLLVFAGLFAAGIAVSAYSGSFDAAVDAASEQFEAGTNGRAYAYYATAGAGSGVQFDDGGSLYGALYLKILYTLFAPFPWQGGTVGFNIGKIDAAVNVYFVWRAYLAIKRHWRDDKGILLTLLSFVIPMTVAYAVGLYNVGLVLRQRMPVVLVIMLLGALSWVPSKSELSAQEDEDEDEEDEEDENAGAPVAAQTQAYGRRIRR
jgi:hypothetical protein